MAPLVAREGKGVSKSNERDLLCWAQQLAAQTFSRAVWRKAAGVAANQMTGLVEWGGGGVREGLNLPVIAAPSEQPLPPALSWAIRTEALVDLEG